MPRKEYLCQSCDNYFTLSYKGGDLVEYCPFCSEELEQADSNEFELDED